MNKFIVLSLSLIFITLCQIANSYSQNGLKVKNSDSSLEVPFNLNKESESKDLDEKQIDVEMLGLDDIDEKEDVGVIEEIAVENLPSGKIANESELSFPVVKMPESDKREKENDKLAKAEKKRNDKIKEEEVSFPKVAFPDKKEVNVSQDDDSNEKGLEVNNIVKSEKKDGDNNQDQDGSSGILGKIQGFIDRKSDKGKKKVNLKLLDALSSKDEKVEVVKDDKELERINLAKEKKERLDKLREKYLIKLTDDGKFKDTSEKIIVPKKKHLSWGDSFNHTVDMPPPLLSRDRSADNSHIPIIPTFKEKVASLFSTIRTDDISAFNNAYSKITVPDLKNHRGDTILTYAMLIKNHSVASAILSKGADPDLPNALGYTPLDIAIENMDLKGVKILIDNQANINYVDRYNRTFLMLATRKGYLPIVQILVENGAKVNEVDSHGRTALTIAYRHKKEIVAKYLIVKGAKAWIEKPYNSGEQRLIKELENRWKRPVFNSQ